MKQFITKMANFLNKNYTHAFLILFLMKKISMSVDKRG